MSNDVTKKSWNENWNDMFAWPLQVPSCLSLFALVKKVLLKCRKKFSCLVSKLREKNVFGNRFNITKAAIQNIFDRFQSCQSD